MEIVVIFGLPGAGKTFVGELLQKEFGFFLYEGDVDMPQELQQAIREQTIVSDELREAFFDNLISKAKKLQLEHDKLVVTQVFIKEKFRERFLREFPHAKFILVEARAAVREERLSKQTRWKLSLDYWRKMAEIFEKPKVTHKILVNNEEGEEKIKEQIVVILNPKGSRLVSES